MARTQMPPGTWGDIKTTTMPDGRVEGRVYYRTLDGRRREANARGRTKAAVERDLKERLPSLVGAVTVRESDAPKTFTEVAEEWLSYEELKLPQHDKAGGTHVEHKRMVRKHLVPAFGALPIGDVTSERVFRWYSALAVSHRPLARNTKGVLSLVLGHALNLGYITGANPCASVKSLKRVKREIFAPGVEELAAFREAIVAYMEMDRPGPRPGPLMLDTVDMILATGLRISEVLGLRFGSDIVLAAEEPYCVVNGAIKEKGPKRWEPFPKTEAGRRELPLPPFAVEIILRRMVENTTGSEFLFHTRTGAPNGCQDVHRAIRTMREVMGLDESFVPHALRKNVGTQVANLMGLEAAAGVLGHARSRVTEAFYAKRELRAPDARAILQAQYEAIVAREG